MKHYSEFKKEVNGIIDVKETLKSLEKISASKVKIIKNKINSLELYTTEIYFLLKKVLVFYNDEGNILINPKKDGCKILLVITGEKGLVGSLWQKIIDKTKDIEKKYDKILVIGKKGFDKMVEEKITSELFFSFSEENLFDENIKTVNKKIIDKFKEKNINNIDILYSYSKSLSEQEIKLERLLPFKFEKKETKEEQEKKEIGFPIFGSSKKKIFEDLLEKYIKTFFYKIILNSKLSENSSKTLEMEHAAEKSKKVIKGLKNTFRKENRKKINQAQLETISAKNIIKKII